MKLIDLLVQELPKRGGWPDGYDLMSTNRHGWVSAYKNNGCVSLFELCIYSSEQGIVTRDQYESALAALQKPAWNGEGLPPVGAKVEFFINPKLRYSNDWIPDAGTEMEVVAHKTTTDGNDVAVCYWDEGGAGRSCCFVPESLKPLRTEADKKRDAALDAIYGAIASAKREHNRSDEADEVYKAIAAGKIPGVKLED